MTRISVNLPPKDESYEIEIVENFIDNAKKYIKDVVKTDQYVIIADDNIAEIYGEELKNKLKKGSRKVELLSFDAGEKAKTWKNVEFLVRKMIQLGFDRKCCVIALGGGVTGDLGGFVASVFLRGVDLIHVPTSLLAMVDSSVGGKTGVDVPEGKNLMGSFYQPKKVFIDPEFLLTLPDNQFINGLSEVVKYGIIWDKRLFSYLDKNAEAILSRDPDVLKKVIAKNIKIKSEIVMKDVKESRLRRILNFGHTYGHAIEAQSKYALLHGEAVAIGMHFACKIAEEKGFKETKKILSLLRKLKLPICPDKKYDIQKILSKMHSDKKSFRGRIYFVLPKKIGEVYFEHVSEKELMETMKYFHKKVCPIV